MLDRTLYNTVLSQVYSPCGRYLLAGNTYGQLAIFDLERILNPPSESLTSEYNKPKKVHTIDSEAQICSLASTEHFLIIGTVGQITGWEWKTILTSKTIKPSWTIQLPSNKSLIEQRDINSFWLNEDSSRLYAGCGDNNVYAFHLEDGRLLKTYEGHNDYVHCVHGIGDRLVSASEDGTVKVWDVRSERPSLSVEPHARSQLTRTDLGKWVGAAALSDDWILCGGGPRLALWHLRTLEPVTTMDLPDHGIHVASFMDDSILAAGAARHLYIMNLSGDINVELPVSATTVYSALARTEPNKVFCVAGSSDKIDLCTTFNYRDQVLQWR